MTSFSGAIRSDIYQIDNLISPMLRTLSSCSCSNLDGYTFKNAQLGTCGEKLETNARKTIFLAIDGIIDDADSLRKKINPPKTDRDIHVVILAYEKWGTDFLEHIEGDFALALLDQEKEQFFIARDRIGKKPLYWYHEQDTFLFGSEIKGLLATGLVPQTPDPEALASYLYFGFIPQDMTPIKGVNKLLPGHYMLIQLNQNKRILPYWSYSSYFEEQPPCPLNEIPEQLDKLLSDTVKMQTPKEGRLGCFTDGGLGSASIAYYLSQQHDPASLSSFSVGLAGETDEADHAAKLAANTLHIDHHAKIITPDIGLDELVKLVWHLDEPVAIGIFRSWQLSKLAQGSVDTVFSGTGSDEMLAGHARYSTEEQHLGIWEALIKTPRAWIGNLLLPILNKIYKPGAYEMLKQSRTNPWQFGYLSENALFSESELAEASPRLAKLFDPEVFLHKFHHLHRIKSTVASYLYFDVKTRLPDSLILQLERCTAAHGLKWRAPYLNRKVVEFLARLPEPEKLSEADTAKFLKASMNNVFPKGVVNAPRRSSKALQPIWLEQSELKELFPLLLKGSLVETGWISESWLRAKLTGDPGESIFQLWGLLVLETWFRLFINHPVGEVSPDISIRDLLMEK